MAEAVLPSSISVNGRFGFSHADIDGNVLYLSRKDCVHIEDWRNRPLQGGRYPYVYTESIYPRRNWGGEHENVAILVAIAVK